MFVSAHNNLFKLVFLNIFMAKQQKDNKFDFNKIEKKWQKKWATEKIFEVDLDKKKPKMYVLEMYPYPSASFLHMGHVRNYTIGDSFARFKRMKGFNVLYPMGYDSFGLPAEMAAKKEGIHPRKYTEKAIEKISEYFKALGNSYDWSKTLASHEPEYYRWNQFFFLKFLEKDLVYSKEAPVNWCENCQSVLANEEAESGKCWRCGNEVIKKNMKQWFFRITKYADRLLDDMDKIEWSDRIKTLQRNWIGKSYGTEIQFEINKEVWPIFTTRPDTIHGVTFMVISAQHPRLLEITADKYKKDMIAFVDLCNKARTPEEIEKLEKEGKIAIVDASPIRRMPGKVKIGELCIGKRDFSLLSLLGFIEDRAKKIKAKRIVIDPITALTLQYDDISEKRTAILDLFEALTKLGTINLITTELRRVTLERKIVTAEFLAHGVILLHVLANNMGIVRGIQIEKMRGIAHDNQIRPYEITERGIEVFPQEEPLIGIDTTVSTSQRRP